MKTIAVDIDDVLSRTAEGFSQFSDEKWGGRHAPENWQETWAVYWGVSMDEAIKRAEIFHNSDAVSKYQPIDYAYDVLINLKNLYKLIVVTSRRDVLKTHTDEWLERYFPGIFEDICYAGIWDSTKHISDKLKLTKADACIELGCDFLIDDQLKHCLGANEAGIGAILFGDYKWNQAVVLPEGVARVKNWSEVEEYFNAGV